MAVEEKFYACFHLVVIFELQLMMLIFLQSVYSMYYSRMTDSVSGVPSPNSDNGH